MKRFLVVLFLLTGLFIALASVLEMSDAPEKIGESKSVSILRRLGVLK